MRDELRWEKIDLGIGKFCHKTRVGNCKLDVWNCRHVIEIEFYNEFYSRRAIRLNISNSKKLLIIDIIGLFDVYYEYGGNISKIFTHDYIRYDMTFEHMFDIFNFKGHDYD